MKKHNFNGGTYFVKVGGYLSGPSLLPGVALIGINYILAPVPEPETFAMLLAGLGLVGAVTLRRRKLRGGPSCPLNAAAEKVSLL